MSRSSALAAATGVPVAVPVAPSTPAPVLASVPTPAAEATGTIASAAVPAAQVSATPPGEAGTEAGVLDSSRFAAVAKREAKLVADQQAVKAEREDLAREKSALETRLAPFEKLQVERAKDPVAALRGLGFTNEEIVNYLAEGGGEPKELTPAEIATKAAQDVIDKARKEDAEKAQKARIESNNQTIARFQSGISDFVGKNAERFEYCAHYGEVALAEIYQTVQQVLLDTNELIPVEEAAQMVEDMYKAESDSLEAKRAKKKADSEAVAAASAGVAQTTEVAPATAPKVITNGARPTIAVAVNKPETREEKRERLVKMIEKQGLRAK